MGHGHQHFLGLFLNNVSFTFYHGIINRLYTKSHDCDSSIWLNTLVIEGFSFLS